MHENVIEYLLVLKLDLNECCRTCIVNIDHLLDNPMIPVCRNALNVVKDDLIIRIDELGRFVYIYTRVIPCQINQFFAKFASHHSDFDEIWYTCR